MRRILSTPFLLFSLLTCLALPAHSQLYTISTVAGTDRVLNGHAANMVPLGDPRSVSVDRSGNYYVVDGGDNRIRRVDLNGIITTFAGTGEADFTGDRGPAASAALNAPYDIAFDGAGNAYIADRGNSRVRRVAPDGTITTFAGNGNSGSGGNGGKASSAQVTPLAVATDRQGNVYISDINSLIRKVDTSGIITTIGGTGSAGYSDGLATSAQISIVTSIAVDDAGNIYLADIANFRVRKIDTSGVMSTFAGSGDSGLINDGVPAIQAVMVPVGLTLDGNGNLLLSDINLDLVRRVNISSGIIDTIAGNGTNGFSGDNSLALNAQLNAPSGLAVGADKSVYIADRFNQRIRRVAANIISTVAGTNSHDYGPATSAFLDQPGGIAAGPNNQILIADTTNAEARVFTPGGTINPIGQLNGFHPLGAAVDRMGNFFVSTDEPRIFKITPDNITSVVAGNGTDGYAGDMGPATAAAIGFPPSVAVDLPGNVYLTDFENNRIRKVDAKTNNITTIAGNGSFEFSGDNAAASAAGIDPIDAAVDAKGNLYVADRFNDRIRRIDAITGIITTVAGDGTTGFSGDGGPATKAQLNGPAGIAIDSSGNLWIADRGNAVVRRVTPSGLIITVAGDGMRRPAAGDNGPALKAQIDPWRLAVDPAGNIFITDLVNNLVRRLTPVPLSGAAFTIASGNNQSAIVGTALPNLVVLKLVTSGGTPVPGVEISFTVSPAGAATLSPPAAITLPDGTATINVTLGGAVGAVTISAVVTGLPAITISATAISPTAPRIGAGGVIGAGLSSPVVRALTANGIASIFGEKFAAPGTARQITPADLVNGIIPTNFAGVCAQFNAVRAPILAVFTGQLNVQVPVGVSGAVNVQVLANCDATNQEQSNLEPVTVQARGPEFFYFTHGSDGRSPIAAIDAITGVYIGAPGLIPGATTVPATPTEILTLFGTGFGATDPAFASGVLPTPPAQVTTTASITIGGVPLAPSDILYVGITQFAGLYQINLRVPDSVPDGDQPVVVTLEGVASPVTAFITVRRTM